MRYICWLACYSCYVAYLLCYHLCLITPTIHTLFVLPSIPFISIPFSFFCLWAKFYSFSLSLFRQLISYFFLGIFNPLLNCLLISFQNTKACIAYLWIWYIFKQYCRKKNKHLLMPLICLHSGLWMTRVAYQQQKN